MPHLPEQAEPIKCEHSDHNFLDLSNSSWKCPYQNFFMMVVAINVQVASGRKKLRSKTDCTGNLSLVLTNAVLRALRMKSSDGSTFCHFVLNKNYLMSTQFLTPFLIVRNEHPWHPLKPRFLATVLQCRKTFEFSVKYAGCCTVHKDCLFLKDLTVWKIRRWKSAWEDE